MRFAVGLPNVGDFGDPATLVELARSAERSGWDGVFVWDHLLYHDPSWPVADPIVVASAIAVATERVRFGVLMLALPRRRPWKVAKELATMDRLSGGRLIAGVGLGSMDAEYAAFGEAADLRVRAERLDEGLEVLTRCWSGEEIAFEGRHHDVSGARMLPTPLQRPRVPIWVAGRWPNPAPFRRAARWDGMMPVHAEHGRGETMPVEAVAAIRDDIAARRGSMEGFDLALEGRTDPGEADSGRLAAYARAGVTWWVEALGWWRGDPDAARRRIEAGPTPLASTPSPSSSAGPRW